MFSDEKRCIYRNNQLAEVICQLRFPEIGDIQQNQLQVFQNAVRKDFPAYSSRREIPAPKLTGAPGNLQVQKQAPATNHQFASTDGIWRINLTGRFISLSCSRYTCWEDFARRLDQPLVAFLKTFRPECFERVGLRYVNFISRRELELEDTPFSELIQPAYLGLLQEDDVIEAAATRNSVDAELNIREGCKAKIHAGPGLVRKGGKQDSEVKFVLDLDLFKPGKIPVRDCVDILPTLHAQADSIFRGAITDMLHDAMESDEK